MPVEFIRAASAADYQAAASLFREYAAWLGIDLSFQDFENELLELRDQYGPPNGGIILCRSGDAYIGCAGVREWEGEEAELKRMYLQPQQQGKGFGKRLLTETLELARELGYKSIRLDTLDKLEAALQLYRQQGFTETPPYYHNPNAGVIFMQLTL
jgi:putative acetyltransferase